MSVDKKKNISIVVLFIFLALVLFWNKLPFSRDVHFIDNDFNSFYANWTYAKIHIGNFMQGGELPHWIPTESLGGQPFIGNGFASLYPLNILAYLIANIFGIEKNIVFLFIFFLALHFAIGGVYTFFFFHSSLSLRSFPAIIGACIFVFSPIMIVFTEAPPLLFSSIWLPAILYHYVRYTESRRWAHLYFSGAFLGLSLLGSYLYNSFLVIAFFFVFILVFHRVALLHTKEYGTYFRKYLAPLMAIIIIASGFWALEFFPQSIVQRNSFRNALTIEESSKFSLTFGELSEYFLPIYYDNDGNVFKYNSFPWVVFFLLGAGFSVLKRNRFFLFFLAAGSVALVVSLGVSTFVHNILYEYVPLYSLFRRPSTAQFIVSFCIAGGTAFVLNAMPSIRLQWKIIRLCIFVITIAVLVIVIISRFLTRDDLGVSSILIGSLFFFLCAIVLVWAIQKYPQKRILWESLFAGVLIIQLFSFTTRLPYFNLKEEGDQRQLFGQNHVQEFLDENLPREQRVNYTNTMMARYLSGIYSHAQVGEYQPLAPRIYSSIAQSMAITSSFLDEDVIRIMRLGSVKYVISHEKIESKDYIIVDEHTITEDERFAYTFLTQKNLNRSANAGEKVYIYELKDILPRAYVVDNIVSIQKTSPKDLRLLKNIRGDAIVECENLCKVLAVQPDDHLKYDISNLNINNNTVTMNVASNKNALLVLSDTFYPGWRVFVDDHEEKIYRTNFYMRGVFVDSGQHAVEFRYDTKWFQLGVALFITTALIGVGILLYETKKYKGKHRNLWIFQDKD